jgi:MobC-like protein
MARPRISDIEKRVAQVNIRFTNDEKTKVNEYATASGLSPANWIRAKVFTGKFPTVKMSPLDVSIYQELKKIGVNLNQATHKINLGNFPKEYPVLQLQLQALLDKILKTLIDDRQPDKG